MDAVDEALKILDGDKPAEAAAPSKPRKNPAAYTIQRFKDSWLAKGLNFAADSTLGPDPYAVELGEAYAAAIYYAAGAPPPSGDGGPAHPYMTALERTGRYALQRRGVKDAGAGYLASIKGRFKAGAP